MHPAEHRALRELYVFTRQLGRHWGSLAKLLGGAEAAALGAGAKAAEGMLGELAPLTGARGLPTATMARFASHFASARPGDPGPRAGAQPGAALRGARRPARRDAARLRREPRRRRRRRRAARRSARAGSASCAPTSARPAWRPSQSASARTRRSRPADGSLAGRAGAKVNSGIGAFGEWFDGRR